MSRRRKRIKPQPLPPNTTPSTPAFTLVYAACIEKDLKSIPQADKDRIGKKLKKLEGDPHNMSGIDGLKDPNLPKYRIR